MSLLPPDDDLELLHTRNYETRVYLVDEDTLLVRGAISDMKPAGVYLQGDPDPLEIHQMHIELRVGLPELVITDARVGFETFPNEGCPAIVERYRELIGISVSRGFTHKVRELFGGPRGCTHTTALLQAMAPAVVQTTWSVSVRRARKGGTTARGTAEERQRMFMRNLNTCHIWAEGGEHATEVQAGRRRSPPLPVRRRLRELGRDEADWTVT